MDFTDIFARIDVLYPEYVNFWADICRIESPTEYKAGVDAVGRYFADKAAARGWRVDIQKQAVSGDCVVITMHPDAPGKPVCFSGHMDTVHPVGFFGADPVKIEDGKIYGPGVCDCKGGLAASFLAMAALDDCGFDARPLKLILQSDEENSSRFSSKTTVEYMCEAAKDAAAVYNVEPGEPGNTVIARKGITRYRLTVHGKSVHSANCYGGKSAICEAAHKIIALEVFKDHFRTTLNCGLISGGTAENTVPSKCTFTADVRFVDQAGMEEADRFVREVAAKSYLGGTTCDVEVASRRSPMERCARNDELLEKINAAYAAAGFDLLTGRSSNGGSDAADFTAHGIPCLDSLGTWGGGIHDRSEWCHLSSLAEIAKRLAASAMYI
ncbi:MAG: M20/M25/M40 family metallo-hydrolase [Clostridia bacterium]|nr:M20/M25/M40 family metallo-hydrolase [Clostridia bacterium]